MRFARLAAVDSVGRKVDVVRETHCGVRARVRRRGGEAGRWTEERVDDARGSEVVEKEKGHGLRGFTRSTAGRESWREVETRAMKFDGLVETEKLVLPGLIY